MLLGRRELASRARSAGLPGAAPEPVPAGSAPAHVASALPIEEVRARAPDQRVRPPVADQAVPSALASEVVGAIPAAQHVAPREPPDAVPPIRAHQVMPGLGLGARAAQRHAGLVEEHVAPFTGARPQGPDLSSEGAGPRIVAR